MPVLSYLRDFAPRAQPAIVRRAYARELIGETSFSFPLALLQAGIVSVLARLLFGVGPAGIATIVAAPMFANLTSTFWARLALGRPKALVLAAIQTTLLLTVVAIALLPTRPAFASAFVGLYIFARCLYAGMLTTRTVIWRANYPRHSRSRITGRLILINTMLFAIIQMGAGLVLDSNERFDPRLYLAVFLCCAAIGVVGVFAYGGLRVRRERKLRLDERNALYGQPVDASGAALDPLAASSPAAPARRVSPLGVLRSDAHFRSYMIWQFFAGVATMAGNTAMILFITDLLGTLPSDWSLGLPQPLDLGRFAVGFLLTEAAMQLAVALSIPFFAVYLDKVHVTRFRTRHGLFWIATQVTSFGVAALAAAQLVGVGWLIVLLLIPRIFQGMVFGGGRLAWQLGHHDFADRHLAATYMAVHQTLTGLRGMTAPFLGALLYAGWSGFDRWGIRIPAWAGIDYGVFAITTLLALIGWLGFVRLDKQVGGDGSAQAHD